MKAAGVHHAAARRSRSLAAWGVGAGTRRSCRLSDSWARNTAVSQAMDCGSFCAETGRTRLGRRPQYRHRVSLGSMDARIVPPKLPPSLSNSKSDVIATSGNSDGIGRQAGDFHHTDRFGNSGRPGRHRVLIASLARPGGQCHRPFNASRLISAPNGSNSSASWCPSSSTGQLSWLTTVSCHG